LQVAGERSQGYTVTLEVTLAVRVPQTSDRLDPHRVVHRLSLHGGELSAWTQETNGNPARATFKFETQARRDSFLAVVLDIPGVSVVELEQQAPLRDQRRAVNVRHRVARLRADYRKLWDAHQDLVDRNTRLMHSGQRPSNEQLIEEQRAADAAQLARDVLLAAFSDEEEAGD